jgi:predicted nucleic acid-binding protein
VKTSRGAEPLFAGGVRGRYIESSALFASRFEGDAAARQSIVGEGIRFTSALTLAEVGRRLVRGRVADSIDESQFRAAMLWLRRFERSCHIVQIDGPVLTRVRRSFPGEPLRTLDAIHLATLEAWEDDPSQVVMVTRDRRIADNARAMGYLVE